MTSSIFLMVAHPLQQLTLAEEIRAVDSNKEDLARLPLECNDVKLFPYMSWALVKVLVI